MLRLELLLTAVDRVTAPLRALGAAVDGVRRAADRVGQAVGVQRLARALGQVTLRAREAAAAVAGVGARVGGIGAVAGGAAAFGFNQQFVRPAADMERYRLTLETVEGSAAAAERALAWVDRFAARTPFEMGEVTRAFVDIRNLGLDPTRGALEAAGNAAAIMGTRYGEAVTALSAALRGEMDPLERFGVFARTEGENIVMEWEAHGRRMRAVVDKNNRGMVAAAIQRAWTDKFAGGMDRLSTSWDGMLSNLSDAWTRFTQMVMNAGVFDWLKGRLQDLLTRLGQLAEDGTLQRWANDTAAALLRVFGAIERFFTRAEGAAESPFEGMIRRFSDLVSPLAAITDRFGVMETAIGGLALVAGGQIIGALALLTGGILALGRAMMATPLGWMFALAGVAVLLWQNWDGIAPWLDEQWTAIRDGLDRLATGVSDKVRNTLAAAAGWVRRAWEPIGEFFEGLWGRIQSAFETAWNFIRPIIDRIQGVAESIPNLFPRGAENPLMAPEAQAQRSGNFAGRGGLGGFPPVTDPDAPPVPLRQSAPPPPVRLDAGGQLRIRIEDGRAPAVSGRPNDDRFRWSLDQGPAMVTP